MSNTTLDLFFPNISSFDLSAMLAFKDPDAVTHAFIAIIAGVFCLAAGIALLLSLYYFFKNSRLKSHIKGCSDGVRPLGNANSHPAFRAYADACATFANGDYFPAGSDYFNDSTLAPSLLRSRVLPMFVTMLTGLGVLGTFVGLTIGLAGLHLDGASKEIVEQIANMTECASTAFVTSVWGVASSLLLGFFLKVFSAGLHSHIVSIQKLVARKFPESSPAEVFMQDVSENLRGSKDTLDLLAEKIGNSMQEAAKDMSDRFDASVKELTSRLTEALKAQTTNANSLHQITLSTMQERSVAMAEAMSERISAVIKDSIGEAILPAVQQMMAASTENMRRSSEELKNILEHFSQNTGNAGKEQATSILSAVENLQQALQASSEANRSMFDALSRQQSDFAQVMGERHDRMLTNLQTMLTKQHGTVDQMVATSAGLSGELMASMQEILSRQQSSVALIDDMLQKNTITSGDIIKEIQQMLSVFADNVKNMRGLSSDMETLCNQIRSASTSMENMGRGIDSTMKLVSSSVTDSLTMASHLVEESTKLGTGLTSVSDKLSETGMVLDEASETFTEAAKTASGQYAGLASKYEKLQTTLAAHVRDMNEQLDEMVQKYGEHAADLMKNYVQQVTAQTAERLRSWDSQTKDFCERMTDVVAAMGEVIEENSQRRG